MEEKLEEAKNIISNLLMALEIANNNSESDLFRIHHNDVMDHISEAEIFLNNN